MKNISSASLSIEGGAGTLLLLLLRLQRLQLQLSSLGLAARLLALALGAQQGVPRLLQLRLQTLLAGVCLLLPPPQLSQLVC